MANYTGLAATAERLIEAWGRDITIVKQGTNPVDDTKPWRDNDEFKEASVPGKGVFGDFSQLVDTDNHTDETKHCIFAANNDGGYDLSKFNYILDGTTRWRISLAQALKPGDTKIMYIFEVTA